MVLDEDLLMEKQIIINGGAPYGQVVFLVGGSASGKGFARTHFMDSLKFKLRDVDEWKQTFLKLSTRFKEFSELPACKIDSTTGKPIRTGKCNPYGVLKGLDLTNPTHVLILHRFLTNMDMKNLSLRYLLSGATPGRLPNILFDITLQGGFPSLSSLLAAGYKPENMHVVWVLTNYDLAVQRNRERERRVPDDIILLTHERSAVAMANYIEEGFPSAINGSVYVILNNQEETKFYDKTNIVKDFKYLKLKSSGSSEMKNKDILLSWMKKNIPRTGSTYSIFER